MAEQTPTEVLPYTCYIEPSNIDTVASATWAVSPAGPVVGSPSNSGSGSTVLISSVVSGVLYQVTCHIVGASGNQYDGFDQIQGVPHH